MVILACSCTWKFEQCAYAAVSIRYEFSIKLKCVPWFQTAGFGVFAGRSFKQDELLPANWKTLLLPNNFPKNQILRNYVFHYNETHMGLVLDYGSVFNHHESANVRPVEVPPSDNVHFRVRMGFVFFVCESQCSKTYAVCMHACIHAHIHNRYTNT